MTTPGAETWSTADEHADWRQMVSATHLPWRVSSESLSGTPVNGRIRRQWLQDLALVACVCDPGGGERSQRELAKTDGEFLTVLAIESGSEVVEQRGSPAVLRAGSIVVWDSRRPARYRVTDRLVKTSLLIPMDALKEIGTRGRLLEGTVLDHETPAVRLLTGYLNSLSGVMGTLAGPSLSAVRNATLELVSAALQPESVTGRISDAVTLRLLAEREIDAFLADPCVTPAWVAARLGVSTRTLQRAFADQNQTLGDYIRNRRLARARDDLMFGIGSVAAISSRWQFADASHFTRSFKSRYGMTPTDFRESNGSLAGRVAARAEKLSA